MKIFFSLCCPILKSQEGYLVEVTSVVGHKCRTGDQGLRGDEDVGKPPVSLTCHECGETSKSAPGGTRTPNPFLRTELLFH